MAHYAPEAAGDPDSAGPAPSPRSHLPLHIAENARARRAGVIETDIPHRLDCLPFGGFHLLVIVALGVTWILDGLEVTLAGSLSGQLMQPSGLGLSNSQIGLAGSAYLAGAVLGAFVFGWLPDRLGRKKLFSVTLAVYLVATAATGLSWDAWSFVVFRFLTGAGIGGEYTAINSTIQELIPARLRGWTDLLINGSFWVGAAMGAGGSIVLLNSKFIDPALGWRLAFLIGTTIGLFILVMRRWIPESPRWLMTHGFVEEAGAVVRGIQAHFSGEVCANTPERPRVRLRMRSHTPLTEVARALFKLYRRRTLVGLLLMTAQAFFYNAVFFTYALILTNFYGIPAGQIGLVYFAVRGRQRAWADRARPPVRHDRPQNDDRGHLRHFGHLACSHRIFVQPEPSLGADAHRGLDDRVLFRFSGRELCLSDGERDFPAGNSRFRDRILLCDRYRRRRRRGPLAARRIDRYGIAQQRCAGLCARRFSDGRGRDRPSDLGRRRGAQIARDGRPAVVFC
jgi:MFS family permease